MNQQKNKMKIQASVLATLLVLGTAGCIQPATTSLDTILGQTGQSLPASAITLRVLDQSNSNPVFEDNGRMRTVLGTSCGGTGEWRQIIAQELRSLLHRGSSRIRREKSALSE